MKYVTTNIRLPRATLDGLKLKALKERKSLAQLIREAIEVAFRFGATDAGVDPKKDPFYKTLGAHASGLSDGASRHDRDVYGAGD